MHWTKGRAVFAACALLWGANSAVSEQLPKKAASGSGVAEVPGEDIFGFTSPTDVGNPGDTGFENENDGRIGKRSGAYRALDSKYEFNKTVSENWWIAGSVFSAYNDSTRVPGLDDVNRFEFDGLSFEIEHRILRRSAQNPVAVSLSIEPRWGKIEGISGEFSNSFGAAFKLFADAVIVPDRWFWGVNLQYTPQTAQDIMNRDKWVNSSSGLLSAALTYQVSSALFTGVEMRYLTSFDGAFFSRSLGYATYLGPTLLWRINDKISFNTTFQPQIFGHAKGSPDLRLDLENFERQQFRAKLAVTF